MRSRTVIVHFNRQKAAHGLPWTVHLSGQCIPASEVVIRTPVQTVFKPEKKTNPRAWMKTKGTVSIDGTTVTIT